MNKRVIAVVMICVLLLFLVACEKKTVGKRVAIPETSSRGVTGAAVAQPPQQTASVETGKTAAEMLKELQSNPTAVTEAGPKSGTFYPPIIVTGTEREALKQKTRALFTQPSYDPNVQADDDFGAKYHDNDGDVTNLPGEYSDNSGN